MKVTFNFVIALLAMLTVPILAIVAHLGWSVPLADLDTAMYVGAGSVGFCYTLFKVSGG